MLHIDGDNSGVLAQYDSVPMNQWSFKLYESNDEFCKAQHRNDT